MNKTEKKEQRNVRVLTAKDLALSDVDKRKVDPKSFAVAIRALLQNWRQGTVMVKGRSDVSYSNKKPWRQKGTGRARAGSARSPLWRGGGICHGPQPRTRTLRATKEMKRNVLGSLLFDYLEGGRIISLNGEFADSPKTQMAYNLIKDAGMQGKKINFFVTTDNVAAQASFANLAHVRTLFFDQANAFDLASAQSWVILEKDLNTFKDMVQKWL